MTVTAPSLLAFPVRLSVLADSQSCHFPEKGACLYVLTHPAMYLALGILKEHFTMFLFFCVSFGTPKFCSALEVNISFY